MPNLLVIIFQVFYWGSFTKLKSRYTDRPNFRFQNEKFPFDRTCPREDFPSAAMSKHYERNPILTALFDSLASNGLKIYR